MKTHTVWLLVACVLLAPAFLYPNIFGNQPDVIADESYFLTSALSSIQKHTLPGWEFSASGAYYGGVQAYVDTAALVPVVAVEFFIQGHSLTNVELWAALNTGMLMHVLRLVSGAVFLALLFFLGWYALCRQIPEALMYKLLLFLTLLLSNSLVIMLVHTAKVWVFYLIFEILAGALVIAQEYYRREYDEAFIRTPLYVGILLWLGVLAFFQTFVGAFTAGLWVLWAWWLGHVTLLDVWGYVRRWWYLFIIFSLTQISFVWQAFFARKHGSLLDFQGANSIGKSIDWPHRFLAPLHDAFLSQPFVVLYVLLAVLLIVPAYRRALPYSQRYIAIALLHPILVYLFFYPLLGFDLTARYAVMLTLACSFSVVMLLPTRRRAYVAVLAAVSLLAMAVLLQGTVLYWHPSFQKILVEQLSQKDANTAVVVDISANTFQLPLNSSSLQALDTTEKSKSRYAFLLEHLPQVDAAVSFKPLVFYTHTSDERDSVIAAQLKAGRDVELVAHKADELNTSEPGTLPSFFESSQLGTPYAAQPLSR